MELSLGLLESVEFPQKFLSRVGGKGHLGHEGRDEVEVNKLAWENRRLLCLKLCGG